MTSPNIRFSAYSDKWKKETIGDVSKVTSGGTPNRANPAYWGGSIPWVTTSLIDFNKIVSADEFITDDGLKGSSAKLFPKGTLLIALYGQGVTRGKVALLDIDATTNQACAAMMFDKNKVYQDFAFFQLMSKYEAIRNLANDGGQKNLSGGLIKSLELTLPSIKEQRQIADFLSSVDKKMSLLKEKYTLLIQHKKGVMQKLFKQEIRFKDDNGNDFPDWQERTMSQVLKPEVREVAKPSEKYLALGIRSHMKGTFQKPNSDPEAIAMDKLYVVRANDLVVNITFAWEGAIAIAQTEDDGGLVSHRFPTYTFKPDQATHRYFKHIIQLKRFKYMLDIISPGGAGRNRVLSKTEFLKLKWNLPSVKEQEKIADFLDTLDTKIELVNQQIELTQTFKKGLLQQMFV